MDSNWETKALSHLTDVPLNARNVRLLFRNSDSIVPFVGAGLSADFGYPSWHKLIEDLAETAGLSQGVKDLLSHNRFEEAAELISKALPNQFDDTLRDTFSTDSIERPLKRKAVSHVPFIGKGVVLTTNFDCVLEVAFEDACLPFRQVFSGARIREASRAVQLNERCLLKLHGDYRDSENRILTLTEYTRQYGVKELGQIDDDLPLPRVLSQALASRPLLFLGCSLKTDRTIGVISNLVSRYTGVIHFALLSSKEASPERLRQLDIWNIRPLFYPAGRFDAVEAFLDCLAASLRNAEANLTRVLSQATSASIDSLGGVATHKAPKVFVPNEKIPSVRINGFKLFYFRRMQKIGTKQLSKRSGIPDNEIRRLERINDRSKSLGTQWFQLCDPQTLIGLEEALDCRGKLSTGKPDDFLTQYMLFYKMYRGTSNTLIHDEEQLELAFETKAIVFDFDGTLTARTDEETTWEKIWVKLGYSINDCADLHHKYTLGRFDHQQWCNITRDHFKNAHLTKKDINDIASRISLIDGTKETLETLKQRDIKLYILSGSIRQVIDQVLGPLKGLFEEVKANDMFFEPSGLLRDIRGTKYDFEGKATFIRRLIAENGYSPYDVLFIGNSCNDVFASQSGARTLCVNPRSTNPDNKEHWTYLLRRMDNLNQILRFAQL